MGSQQLLLIVLGVIIVGIAVIVGISIFGSNADQSNKDAITQDLIRMAAHAQGYYKKARLLGGGDNSFTGITWPETGVKATGADYTNADGTFQFTVNNPQELQITGANPEETGTVTATITLNNIDLSEDGW